MKAKDKNYLKSMVRTLVPVVAGLIISGLARIGIEVSEPALITVIDGLVIGGYYALARWLEGRWTGFGWLLGLPSQPEYHVAQKPE